MQRNTILTVERNFKCDGTFISELIRLSLKQIEEQENPTRYLDFFNIEYASDEIDRYLKTAVIVTSPIFQAMCYNSRLLKRFIDQYRSGFFDYFEPLKDRYLLSGLAKHATIFEHILIELGDEVYELLSLYIHLHIGNYNIYTTMQHQQNLILLDKYQLIDYFKFYYVYTIQYQTLHLNNYVRDMEILEIRSNLQYDNYITNTINLFGMDMQFLTDGVDIIDRDFSKGNAAAKTVTADDLDELNTVYIIEGDFFSLCFNLVSIDLSPLRNVVSIGNNFLRNAYTLSSLDLSPLVNLEYIGDNFLSGCSDLTELKFGPHTKVRRINNGFLSNCPKLTSLDLTSFVSLEAIGDDFGNKCSKLNTIIFSDSARIKSLGDNFLISCLLLKSLDLSAFKSITHIKNGFLSFCLSLKNLDLSPLKNVKMIGDNFLVRYGMQRTIDLSAFNQVTHIGNKFLAYNSLSYIDLNPLVNLLYIGDDFLSGCSYLSSLDLKYLVRIVWIGDNFVSKPHKLYTPIDLRSLNLNHIGTTNANILYYTDE